MTPILRRVDRASSDRMPDPTALLLAGSVAATSLVVLPWFTRFAPLKDAVAAVGATICFFTFVYRTPGARLGRSAATICAGLAFFWLWALLSLRWSPAPGAGTLLLARIGAGGAIFIVAATSPSCRLIFAAGALTGTLNALLGFLQLLWPEATWLGGTLGGYPVGTIGNPNHFAGFLALCAPMALGFALLDHRRWAGQAGLVGWAVMLGGNLAAGSRGGLIAFVLASALLVWLVRPTLRRWLWRGGLLLLLAGLAVLRGTWTDQAVRSARGRTYIFTVAKRALSPTPLHGTGAGGGPRALLFAQAEVLARSPGLAGRWSNLRDAHNALLDLTLQLGLIGLAPVLLIAAILVLRWRRVRRDLADRDPEEAEASGGTADVCLVGLVAVGIHGLTESAHLISSTMVWVMALSGMLCGRAGASREWSSGGAAEGGGEGKKDSAGVKPFGLGWKLLLGAFLIWCVGALTNNANADLTLASALKLAGGRSAGIIPAAGASAKSPVPSPPSPVGSTSRQADVAAVGDGALRGRLGQAFVRLSQATARAADPAVPLFYLARVGLALGRLDRAGPAARSSFALVPSVDTAVLAGNIEMAAGRSMEAVGWYRRAVRLHPRYARARANLAVALVRIGRRREALEAAAAARRLRPSDPRVQRVLGRAGLLDKRAGGEGPASAPTR